MTKFILHGGFSIEKFPAQEDDNFFQEILKDKQDDVKILLVYFAERDDMVSLRIEQDKESFNKNKGSKKLEFKIASEENFVVECKWADIIYLHGGRTIKLMEKLEKFGNIEQIFSSKTIVGDSAGVNVLAQFSYGKNSKEIKEGFRILPFKVVVHYIEGDTNPLEKIEPDIETVFLREYETKVFYF